MRVGCRTGIPRPGQMIPGPSTNITNILPASERPMWGEQIFRSGITGIGVPDWRTKAMRNGFKGVLFVSLLMFRASLPAQTTFPVFNPPPCDFSDKFYTVNG